MWAAFPPLELWPLAWCAPIGWLYLVMQPEWTIRRPYRMLFVAGFAYWMLMIQWIRLPHWLAHFGWVVLSLYLAAYVPVFVAAARGLVHGCRLPLLIAAPIAWTGLEWLRGYVLTGFSIGLLGHTQVHWLGLIQVADWIGACGVSFLVMLGAVGLFQVAKLALDRDKPTSWATLSVPVTSVAVILICLGYGQMRMRAVQRAGEVTTPFRVALIQGSLDTQFDGNLQRVRDSFFDYVRLSGQAVSAHPDVDLMIWPESMFTSDAEMVSYDEPVAPPLNWPGTASEWRSALDERRDLVSSRFTWVTQQAQAPIIIGMEWDHYRGPQADRHNSALLIDRQGKVQGRYDKMHPVMFGEYIPLGGLVPWLYQLAPMSSGIEAGQHPQAFRVAGHTLSPTICFENTVARLMRRQVNQLTEQGETPDVLVTITNDGWFWGSSLLDMHLACGVFRAVELRRPLLIAANTGFSASIDAAGRVRAKGPRRAAAVVYDELPVPPSGTVKSAYLRFGDWLGCGCFLITIVGWPVGNRRLKQASTPKLNGDVPTA